MDGVLVDSEGCIRAACIKMFKNRGLAVTNDDFIPFTGMGENKFIGGVAEKYGLEFSIDMKAEAYALYGEIAGENVVVYEGVRDLIMALKRRGYKLAVASAADHVKVIVNLRCMGLSAAEFDAIVTGNDVTNHKPDPEAFLLACEKLNGNPDESVVIEDALAGCRAAKAANMTCIGVTSTFAQSMLRNAGADYVVEKTADIADVLDTLTP